MINVLELVYGGGLTPNANPIHVFDAERDLYEHAEFEKYNGDFYQIVKISDSLVKYHFQKTEAEIECTKLEGNWWLRHEDITREYKNRGDIFFEKINDRIKHGYTIKKLVVSRRPQILDQHPDYKIINEVFPR
jgi:hypothetical protein